MVRKYRYAPDYAVPPGATLRETLEAKGISQKELAIRTGLTEKHVSQIIRGLASITHGSALKLERALGVPARFWNNLERDFAESKVMIEEAKRFEQDCQWLKTIPVSELVKREYVRSTRDKVAKLRQVLDFFGVSSVEAWHDLWLQPEAVYRRSRKFPSKPELAATWLRMGELAAQETDCRPYSEERFQNALGEIRKLTLEPPELFQPTMIRSCAEAGVAVAFVPEIRGAGISGATRWLSKDKAMILLSLLGKRNDRLWFTFFHEAGHIALHGKLDVFLEDDSQDEQDEKEAEADRFAADILIPPQDAGRLPSLRTREAIAQFAQSIGISPGIVVGRWQHETQQFHRFNDLKRRLCWAHPAE